MVKDLAGKNIEWVLFIEKMAKMMDSINYFKYNSINDYL